MDITERNKELSSIIDGLSRHLDFLEYAGVKDLSASAWSSQPATPAVEPVAAPAPAPLPREAPPRIPADEKAPVVLCLWRLAGAVAFVEGVRVSKKGAEHFSPAHIVQFEKLAGWMSGELGIKEVFSAKNGWRGEYPTPEAGAEAVAGELRATPPRMVVTLGPVAAGALLGSPDVKTLRARFHDLDGLSVVATHSPGAILEDKLLKKETHDDLLMALHRLK